MSQHDIFGLREKTQDLSWVLRVGWSLKMQLTIAVDQVISTSLVVLFIANSIIIMFLLLVFFSHVIILASWL